MKNKSKKMEIPKNETGRQRFQRIVTHRADMLGKTYNLITRLPKQPSYDVTQEDAKKLLVWVEKFHAAFTARYTPLANGEKISKSDEKEITKIF